MALTKRKANFIQEYSIDLNGTQAAIRAGFSPKSARSQASQLLKEPAVRSAIQSAMDERNTKLGLNAQWVLAQLHGLYKRVTQEVKPALNSKTGKPLTDPETGAALYTFNAQAALKTLELIGKHVTVNAFKDVSEVQHTGDAGEYELRLAKVRAKVLEDAHA